MKYLWMYETEFGVLGIAEENGAVTDVTFDEGVPGAEARETELLRRASEELCEYFAGARKSFGLPLAPKGTPFQRKVWDRLLAIPYGATACYAEIAEDVGSPKAFRAVGMANHVNPIPILIPCHRVVGKDGKLTGYAGGLATKERLLALERRWCDEVR